MALAGSCRTWVPTNTSTTGTSPGSLGLPNSHRNIHRPSGLQLAPAVLSFRILGVQRQHTLVNRLRAGRTIHFWQITSNTRIAAAEGCEITRYHPLTAEAWPKAHGLAETPDQTSFLLPSETFCAASYSHTKEVFPGFSTCPEAPSGLRAGRHRERGTGLQPSQARLSAVPG